MTQSRFSAFAGRRRAQKALLSLAALGVAGAMAGLGTFAGFSSTTSASNDISSGTVIIALGDTGAATNRLTVDATGIVPGDTIERSFDLANTGSEDLASITMTTEATVSSILDTDTTDGLQMLVERCSTGWAENGTEPAFTYTCSGTRSTVVASRPVIGADIDLGALSALTANQADHLLVTLTFPTTAGNSFQNQTSTISYSVTGTQRPGSAH